MPSLLRDRNFALMVSGETISELGSDITFLAFPLIAVAVLHASPFAVGAISAATNAAWLFVAVPAGVWADRIRRRPILIASDLASAVLLASIPLAWSLGLLSVAQLAVVGFLVGAFDVIFNVAYPAFLPSVVPADRLVEGNGVMEASSTGARIAGPGLGGLLVQVLGAPVTLLADAISFLVSAATLTLMRVDESRPDATAERVRFRDQVGEGIRYVFGSPLLRTLVSAVTVANGVFGAYTALLVLFLNRQVGLGPGVIGVLFALGSVGGILGALAVTRIVPRIGSARLLWCSPAISLPFLLLVPFTQRGFGVVFYIVGGFGTSAGIAAFNVAVRAAIQTTVPSGLLGRVTASTRMFSRGALPIGALVGGALAGATSPRIALLIVLACYAFMPLRMRFSPLGRVRDLDELAPAAGDPAKDRSTAPV